MFFKKKQSLSTQELEQKKELQQTRNYAIISGLLFALAFPPIPLPYLSFCALIPLLFSLSRRKTLLEINRATYLFGFVLSVITLYWVGAFTERKDAFLMIGGGLLLFINPIFFLIPSTLYFAARKVFNEKIALMLFPFFWASYEYFYMNIDANFPWVTISHQVIKFTHFIQIADIIGALGLTISVIYVNIFFFLLLKSKVEANKFKWIWGVLPIGIMLVFTIYGAYRINSYKPTGGKVKVAAIQPNLDPYDKWSGGSLHELTTGYIQQSENAIKQGAKIIFWPETALPIYLMAGNYNNTVLTIRKLVDSNNVYLVTGMPDLRILESSDAVGDAKSGTDGSIKYLTFNSVLAFSPNTEKVERYGKIKLVPFGERTPYIEKIAFLAGLFKWGVGISSWNVGRDTTPVKLQHFAKSGYDKNSNDSLTVGGIICFESVFPYYTTKFVQKGAKFFALVTNDSWYGNTSGPYQHRDISILRAVETRRNFIRAANGGISCIIDTKGEIKETTKMYEKNILVGDIELNDDITLFVKSDWVIPALANFISIGVIALSLVMFIKRKLKL